jgi:hypothetical protein
MNLGLALDGKAVAPTTYYMAREKGLGMALGF